MSSPRNTRRPLPAAAVALLVLAGCFYEPRTEPPAPIEPAPGADVNDANVIERSELDTEPVDMQEYLEGRVPGVLVQRIRGDLSVQIRGQRTINGNNEAMIVIDGIQSTSRSLLLLDPSDVERVEVLKDASAAFYGMRGANGVLVVTTRR